jgi:hypothetical protein
VLRLPDWTSARRFRLDLAAVLWRFLDRHEQCLARRAGVRAFTVVMTVPSGDAGRDARHPLPDVVGELVGHTRDRYERLLDPAGIAIEARATDPRRYVATRGLESENVLLIDDTWTTGANAESGAAVLKAAGAGVVGIVVIGRHIHEEYADNAARLRALPRFSWDRCALCAR